MPDTKSALYLRVYYQFLTSNGLTPCLPPLGSSLTLSGLHGYWVKAYT
jgi:hypothetical protein